MILLARNEEGVVCMVVLAALAFVFALAWRSRMRHRDLRQAFASVARWYHGTYRSGAWRTPPSVFIPYGQTMLRVAPSVAEGGRRCTEAHFDWPDPAVDLRIASRSIAFNVLRMRAQRTSVIELGEPQFERDFTVVSDDYSIAKATVTGGVRSALTMLARIRGGAIDVSFSGGHLTIRKLSLLDQPAELSAFVRHSLELYDQAMLSRTVGIEFVQHAQLSTIDDARCPVCGDAIHDDAVLCSRCKTPHHRECWIYCGKCATYGCGETDFMIPRITKPR